MNSQELRLATYQMAAKYGAFMGLFLIVRYMAEPCRTPTVHWLGYTCCLP